MARGQILAGMGAGLNKLGCLGRIVTGAFFGVFLGMGLLFTVLIIRSLVQGQPKVMAFFILVPLIFVAVGAAGVYAAIKGPKPRPAPGSGLAEPLSDKAAGPCKSAWATALFFLAFLVAGLAASYALLVKPAMKLHDARSWWPVKCTIVSSEVGRHRGSKDGTTYSVDITYDYEVDGGRYRSSQYDFLGGSSSGYEGKADIVNHYPPGIRATCYVNPRKPCEAVLDRNFRPAYLLGLLPLVFVGTGAAGLVWTMARARGSSAPGKAGPGAYRLSGPAELKAQASPAMKLAGALLLAAFWNGIVSVFVWQMIEGWRHGHPDGFLTVFMIPFILVGLGLAGLVGYQCLALFNPKIHITVEDRSVPLGGSADLEWRFSGDTSRIERLTVILEGREEATCAQGKNTSTDQHVFSRVELASFPGGAAAAQGRVRLHVPADSVPSLSSPHNKIVWAVKVHAEIPRWPDVMEAYPLEVLPQEGAS